MQYHQEGPPRPCSVRPSWPPPGVVKGESEEGGGGQREGERRGRERRREERKREEGRKENRD